MDIANLKKSRKAIDEVRAMDEWEDSLSAVMKAARSGDKERAKRLVATEGEWGNG